jgi:hypothetical protein
VAPLARTPWVPKVADGPGVAVWPPDPASPAAVLPTGSASDQLPTGGRPGPTTTWQTVIGPVLPEASTAWAVIATSPSRSGVQVKVAGPLSELGVSVLAEVGFTPMP